MSEPTSLSVVTALITISSKIKDLALTLSRKISNTNYKGQSKQMDIFTYNLQNYTYYTKLNTTKLSTASGY